MPFEPEKITRENIFDAVRKIESTNIQLNPSTKFDVVINGKTYPPKEVMKYAHEAMNGELIWENGGGNPTNKFLINEGFEIIKKNMSKIEELFSKVRMAIEEELAVGNTYYDFTLNQIEGEGNDVHYLFANEEGQNYDLYFFLAKDFAHLSTGKDYVIWAQDPDKKARKSFLEYSVKDNKNLFFDEDGVEIKEDGSMSQQKREDVLETMQEFGFNANSTILKIDDINNVNAREVVEELINWVDIRYKTKQQLVNDDSDKNSQIINLLKILNDELSEHIDANETFSGYTFNGRKRGKTNAEYYEFQKEEETREIYFGTYIGRSAILSDDNISVFDPDRKQKDGKTQALRYYRLVEGSLNSLEQDRDSYKRNNTYFDDKGVVVYESGIMNVGGKGADKKGRTPQWWMSHINPEKFNPANPIFTIDNINNIDNTTASQVLGNLLNWIDAIQDVKQKVLENDANRVAEQETENLTIPKPNSMKLPLNTILYGPPGTGKTYHTVNKSIQIANPEFDVNILDDPSRRQDIKEEYDRLVKEGQIVFSTFHQSMSYEDFIEGIKPLKPVEGDTFVKYKVESGIFKELCKKAGQELTEELFKEYYKSFVEKLPDLSETTSSIQLNTKEGNPFELFKNSANSIYVRAGEQRRNQSVSSDELCNVLFRNRTPNLASYEQIIIDAILEEKKIENKAINNTEKNFVLIIDEINRGNVSSIFGELITLIEDSKRKGSDEALEVTLPYSKESFSVPSNIYIIGTMNTADRSVEALDTALRRRFEFEEMLPDYEVLKDKSVGEIRLKEVLETINKRIEILLDRDHLIGHAYFCNVTDKNGLVHAFKNKIIPLLQEYFYGNYQYIELVLGSGFITSKKASAIFASSTEEDLNDKIIYTFPALNDANIISAVRRLLNKPNSEPVSEEEENDEQDS